MKKNKFEGFLPTIKIQYKLIGSSCFNAFEYIINTAYKALSAFIPAIVYYKLTDDNALFTILMLGGFFRILYLVFNEYKLRHIWFRIKTLYKVIKK